MIESFRLGIVPYDCVHEFVFGRESETTQLLEWIDGGSQNTMLVVGEYGSGKTHFLHYAYGQALQAGYAVAFVEMDVNESPFHRPKHVYHQLVRSLRYQNGSHGSGRFLAFRDMLREALAGYSFDDHVYFRRLKGRTIDETLWDWIEGRDRSVRPPNIHESMQFGSVRADFGIVERRLERMGESLREVQRLFDGTPEKSSAGYNKMPGLYPYYKAANIYCYLLSGLAWAAKHILGLPGLLLIFDEAENVDQYENLYQADKSKNFLKALARTADGDARLLDPPDQSGLDFCRMGIGPRIPFLYKPDSGLKLLFGWTPVSILDSFPELRDACQVPLEPLPFTAQRDLLLHLLLLYQDAYESSREPIPHAHTDLIFSRITGRRESTRYFVKGSVEALDLLRTYPLSDENLNEQLDEVLQ